MKYFIILTITVVSFGLLGGCSSLPKKYQPIRNNRDAYLYSHSTSKLKLPKHHPDWQFSPQYVVPDLSDQVKQQMPKKPDNLQPPYINKQ